MSGWPPADAAPGVLTGGGGADPTVHAEEAIRRTDDRIHFRDRGTGTGIVPAS
jgi:hypothetical protein